MYNRKTSSNPMFCRKFYLLKLVSSVPHCLRSCNQTFVMILVLTKSGPVCCKFYLQAFSNVISFVFPQMDIF